MNRKKTILIVEDNLINRSLLKEILINDYEVLEADNGETALNVLRSNYELISLILLDIVMPVMDGYEFLNYVKKDPDLSAIPVIVTTHGDTEMDEVNALSHGATDYVAKPYKPQIILHRVENMIRFRENAALVNLLKYDSLTQLYSKDYFFQRVKETIIRNSKKQYDILCFDIENFKFINDIYGTSMGDKLLCKVADVCRDEPFFTNSICCRFQADQFAVLIETPETYLNNFFTNFMNQVCDGEINHKVTIKWGIYSIDDIHLPIENMCDRAFMAIKTIKGQYGKYYTRYDNKLRDKILKEQEIERSMEAALEAEEFVVYLQPKHSLKDNTLIGAEALVRWNHPKWGLQMPGNFIPLFEKNGFIIKLDQYVFEHTCAILNHWKCLGYKPIPISVNVSRADAYNKDLPEILLSCLEKYDLPASLLHLEITESAYTENPVQLIDMVKTFRNHGFIIEMDDFGSGYSSLNMLNELPIDILKLDIKFVQTEMLKPEGKGILKFIIQLAKWMDLTVIAEGIETEAELVRLREMNCDQGQGYFFSKPLPVDKFENLLKDTLESE